MMLDEQRSASHLPSLGEVVARRYRVHSIVATSSHGVTFRATHVSTGDSVALQIAQPALGDQAAAHRLFGAGRLIRELESEHLARVLDDGLLPNGAPFLVAEWLDGCTVATLLESGAIPLEVAVGFVLQASEALAEMHARGIVHRNLDPRKLFVVRGADGAPKVKLLGCANAKVGAAEDDSLPLGSFFGAPAYRSPEELTGQPIDGGADAWALGVILFELLTQSLPFGHGSAADVLTAIQSAARAQVCTTDARLPRRLDGVLDRCLQAKRPGRIRHIRTLAQALAPFGGPQGSAQLTRIRDIARTASRLPKAVLAPPSDPQPERHSVPPTTSSVRPMAESGRETEPKHARGWSARLGPLALIAASLCVAVFVSPGTTQNPHAGHATEVSADSSPKASALTRAELPAPSASAAVLVRAASSQTFVETINATAVTVTAAPPAHVRVSTPQRGAAAATKRRGHPRLATTVFPEDQPRELFDTRK